MTKLFKSYAINGGHNKQGATDLHSLIILHPRVAHFATNSMLQTIVGDNSELGRYYQRFLADVFTNHQEYVLPKFNALAICWCLPFDVKNSSKRNCAVKTINTEESHEGQEEKFILQYFGEFLKGSGLRLRIEEFSPFTMAYLPDNAPASVIRNDEERASALEEVHAVIGHII